MRVVVVLAVAALASLILALVSGSTLAAVAVVMLALAGIVLLLRDWRSERTTVAATAAFVAPVDEPALTADEHSPDIAGSDQV